MGTPRIWAVQLTPESEPVVINDDVQARFPDDINAQVDWDSAIAVLSDALYAHTLRARLPYPDSQTPFKELYRRFAANELDDDDWYLHSAHLAMALVKSGWINVDRVVRDAFPREFPADGDVE